MKKENVAKKYRILSQVSFENSDGDKITLNAGESLPDEVLGNKEILKNLLDQGRICEVDAEGVNIEKRNDLDESGREVFSSNFLCGLVSPRSGNVENLIKIVSEHNLSQPNLEALKEKIESVLASVDLPILKMLREKVVEQLYAIVVLDEGK